MTRRRPVVEAYRNPARDWPPAQPGLRYAIVTAPRTGSTWLAEALAQTGEAGSPMEYLHPQILQEAVARTGGFQPEAFFAEIERRRTTPNGVFGFKLLAAPSFNSFPEADRPAVARTVLGRLDRAIYLARRDKVAQGVSAYVARQTDLFALQSPQEQAQLRARAAELAFDPVAVLGHVHTVARHQDQAAQYLARYGPAPLSLVYEDMLADPVGAFARVFRYLGVKADPAAVAPPSYPARDAYVAGQTEAFRAWLNGCGEAAPQAGEPGAASAYAPGPAASP